MKKSFDATQLKIIAILYICIFYFQKGWKNKTKWFCMTTVGLVVFMMISIALNQAYHFSHYDWIWYEKTYFLGFMLALPLLKRYNGKKGTYPLGKYFFLHIYCLADGNDADCHVRGSQKDEL